MRIRIRIEVFGWYRYFSVFCFFLHFSSPVFFSFLFFPSFFLNIFQCFISAYVECGSGSGSRSLAGTSIFQFSVLFSDDSDAPSGNIKHLPRRLLASSAEASRRRKVRVGNKRFRTEAGAVAGAAGDTEDLVEQGTGNVWQKRDPGLVGSKIPPYQKPVLSQETQETFDSITSAYQYYKLFQPDRFAEEIVYQSRLYAVQKDFSNKTKEYLTMDNYRYCYSLYRYLFYCSLLKCKNVFFEKNILK